MRVLHNGYPVSLQSMERKQNKMLTMDTKTQHVARCVCHQAVRFAGIREQRKDNEASAPLHSYRAPVSITLRMRHKTRPYPLANPVLIYFFTHLGTRRI